MDELDRAILNRLQGGFPLCERPFAAAAEALGTNEDTLLERLRALLRSGILTRFGPLYDAERLGGAFALCAMAVPRERFDEVAALVNARREVAHNYEREHRFNLWFVLATASREEIDACIRDLERETGCTVMSLPREAEYFIGLQLAA